MKSSNTITIQFWLIRPEGDHHNVDQMRALGQSGVFSPVFTSGQKMLLNMEARFDVTDDNACISAALYAIENAKMFVHKILPGAKVFNPQVWLNGEKKSPSPETQFT